MEENDISVTKFLNNDHAVSKFLGTSSTRFLETNDITVTKFLDTTVTKFLNANDTAVTKYLEANGIPKTVFLDSAIGTFLLDDQAVQDFIEEAANDISVTKFLNA